MHPYRRIPAWLFWPLAFIAAIAWLILIAWLVLRLFAPIDVGTNPIEAIPRLFEEATRSAQ